MKVHSGIYELFEFPLVTVFSCFQPPTSTSSKPPIARQPESSIEWGAEGAFKPLQASNPIPEFWRSEKNERMNWHCNICRPPLDSNSYRGCWTYDLVLVELFWNINKTCWVMSTRCKEQLGKSLFAIKLKPFVYSRSSYIFSRVFKAVTSIKFLIRQSSGSHQAVIRQLSQSSVLFVIHSAAFEPSFLVAKSQYLNLKMNFLIHPM